MDTYILQDNKQQLSYNENLSTERTEQERSNARQTTINRELTLNDPSRPANANTTQNND